MTERRGGPSLEDELALIAATVKTDTEKLDAAWTELRAYSRERRALLLSEPGPRTRLVARLIRAVTSLFPALVAVSYVAGTPWWLCVAGAVLSASLMWVWVKRRQTHRRARENLEEAPATPPTTRGP